MRLSPSPAAQYQATKTRGLLALTLYSQLLSWLFLLWVGLEIWVIWRDVDAWLPQLGHAYFGRWILCGILTDTPLLGGHFGWLHIPINGQYFWLEQATNWLNGPAVYQHSFYTWFWYAAWHGWGLMADLVPLSIAAGLIAWRWQQEPDRSDHLRGLRLIAPQRLNQELHSSSIGRVLHGQPRGLRVGNIVIPEVMEREHFLITGNPGSGKSTEFRDMLQQIEERGQPAIIVDPESEYVQQYYDEHRGDVILNPLDARCPFWSPWSEIRAEWFAVDAAAIAASLIRGRPRNESEKFFQDSTRTVVESILYVARDDPAPDKLLSLVSQPRDALHAALEGTPAYPLIDPGAHEQGAGILGTAVNKIKTFGHLPHRHEVERTWSAREWAENRQGRIFLPSREDLREAIQLLQGLWLDCLVRWLMTAEIDSDQTWVMADELASLGHQPQIEKLLTRGRKRGLAVVLGLQNVSQLAALYGREGSITLTSSPSTKIILRVDETETAQWASDLIGKHETERLTMTQLAGRSSYREGINLSPQRSIEPLVLPDEIKLLEPFHGYLCLAGHHRTTIQIPKSHLIKRYPAFIPRQNATSTPKQAEAPTDDNLAAQLLTRPEAFNG
jgi:Type IV secretion-system coupling protein DNA-binding domain